MIKILHAADLHLDAAFSSLSPRQAAQRRQEQRQMLMGIVELANAEDCQIVLLAGDLFDSDNAYPDTTEAMIAAFSSCKAQIFIAPGNHDYLTAGCVYLAANWPENVHIFKENTVHAITLEDIGCRVYGAAFTSMDAYGLLDGFCAEDDGLVNLMVLHGDCVNAASPNNAISKGQIAASGLDYLALGHIHMQSGIRREGDTFYAWPGCPMGRGFDETGEKGVYIVQADKHSADVRFVPMHGRKYEILTVEVGDDPIAAVLAALPQDTQNDIYRIILTGEAAEFSAVELLRAVEERFFGVDIKNKTAPKRELWAQAQEDTLRGLFLRELKAKYDAADDEGKELYARAARLGLDAMDGREVSEF